MDTVKEYLVYGFFVLIGMSGWIMLETTHIAPPVCVVEQSVYEASSNQIEARVRHK